MQLGSTIWGRNNGPGDLQMCRVLRFLAYFRVGVLCALRDLDFKRLQNFGSLVLRANHCIPLSFWCQIASFVVNDSFEKMRCTAREEV